MFHVIKNLFMLSVGMENLMCAVGPSSVPCIPIKTSDERSFKKRVMLHGRKYGDSILWPWDMYKM